MFCLQMPYKIMGWRRLSVFYNLKTVGALNFRTTYKHKMMPHNTVSSRSHSNQLQIYFNNRKHKCQCIEFMLRIFLKVNVTHTNKLTNMNRSLITLQNNCHISDQMVPLRVGNCNSLFKKYFTENISTKIDPLCCCNKIS